MNYEIYCVLALMREEVRFMACIHIHVIFHCRDVICRNVLLLFQQNNNSGCAVMLLQVPLFSLIVSMQSPRFAMQIRTCPKYSVIIT